MEQIPTTMVMEEMAVPRATHVLARGQYDRPGAQVTPGVPRCLSGGTETPVLDRLALARWLVSPEQPALGAGGREPRLADVLRHRAGQDAR